MVKWVWDINETICIPISKIKYFEITEHSIEYALYATLIDDKAIVIAGSPDLGILKDQIRTIIGGLNE